MAYKSRQPKKWYLVGKDFFLCLVICFRFVGRLVSVLYQCSQYKFMWCYLSQAAFKVKQQEHSHLSLFPACKMWIHHYLQTEAHSGIVIMLLLLVMKMITTPVLSSYCFYYQIKSSHLLGREDIIITITPVSENTKQERLSNFSSIKYLVESRSKPQSFWQ